jgi:hypothetical protein
MIERSLGGRRRQMGMDVSQTTDAQCTWRRLTAARFHEDY